MTRIPPPVVAEHNFNEEKFETDQERKREKNYFMLMKPIWAIAREEKKISLVRNGAAVAGWHTSECPQKANRRVFEIVFPLIAIITLEQRAL